MVDLAAGTRAAGCGQAQSKDGDICTRDCLSIQGVVDAGHRGMVVL